MSDFLPPHGLKHTRLLYLWAFYSVPLIYICLCANTILSWWLWLCSIVWSQAGWFLRFVGYHYESESETCVWLSATPRTIGLYSPWTSPGLYSPWNSPGQKDGVASLSLLQGIFPTQGLNWGLPHCRQILYQVSHKHEIQYEYRKGCGEKKIDVGNDFWI